MPRQVKFNTIIMQNNPQSRQQSETSANTEWHKFQDRVIWKPLNMLVFVALISDQFCS